MRTIGNVLNQKSGVDKRTLIILFHAFHLEVKSSDHRQIQCELTNPSPKLTTKHQDWGKAIDVQESYCCQCPVNQLKQWIIEEKCRIIMLLGMGGIGKTTLSIQLSLQLHEEFDYIIFRSLYNAPPLEIILAELIEFLSQGKENKADFRRLLYYLRSFRCLLIFDALDSILVEGQYAGKYQENYQQYGQLIQMIGETEHQSTLIITSREKTKEIALLEGSEAKVHSLHLSACPDVGLALFKAQNLLGSEAEKEELVRQYENNPLILKIISTSINNLFEKKIINRHWIS